MATALPISPKGDYIANRDRAYNSKAKTLLYGGDEDKPNTPIHHGKRTVAHKGATAAPFATEPAAPVNDADREREHSQHVAKAKGKEGAAKPNERQDFDPEVYRQAIANNYTNMQASKQRNYVGNNVFGN